MGSNKHVYAIDEDDIDNIEEAPDNEEELQAWCLLEESEHEQWQGDQQTRQTQIEESQLCVTIECGEQAKFEVK